MKKVLILVAVSAMTILASCNKKNEHSPSISFGTVTVNNAPMEGNIIHVGDTVKIPLMLNPYFNSLTNFNVITDRSFLKDSVFSATEFVELCNTAASDKSRGVYVFKALGAGTALVISPMYIIPKKSPNSDDKTVTLQLQVKNDSSFSGEFNPVTYTFQFKVYEKEANKDEEEKQ